MSYRTMASIFFLYLRSILLRYSGLISIEAKLKAEFLSPARWHSITADVRMGTMSVGHKHTHTYTHTLLYATLKVDPAHPKQVKKSIMLRETTKTMKEMPQYTKETAFVWKQVITHHLRNTLKVFQWCQGHYIISLQGTRDPSDLLLTVKPVI